MKKEILKLGVNSEIIEWVIKTSGWEIDEEVYKLYGIFDEEKKIIWKSLN